MSYLALARKWRPKTFAEVIGQEHVVSALSNALNNQRVHHAFLFTGTRGVGKTTLARIFAKALNCETGVSAEPCGQCIACTAVDQGNFIDLIEVDAASRTKVDDTRELLDNVQYTPSQGRCKIYLIDEIHMLSAHSFNALLKTLEEPPEHVKFLLATTNPQKLPTTILSRCIQFNLKSIDIGRLTAQLEKILEAEEIPYESSALIILARSANGSVRDALSLLDQAIAFGNGNVSSDNVRSMLGMIDDHFINSLLNEIIANNGSGVLNTIAAMSERTVDYATSLDEIISLIHNISLYLVSPQSVEWKGVDTQAIADLATSLDAETLQLLYQIAITGKRDLEFAPDPRSGFEMVMLRMLAFFPVKRDETAPQSVERPSPGNDSSSRAGEKFERTENADSKLSGNSREPATVHIMPTEIREAEAAEAPGEQDIQSSGDNTFCPEMVLEEGGWKRLIDLSQLTGISREILMNMVPTSVAGNVISTCLDSSSRNLYNKNRIRRIMEHLKDVLSLDVKFDVVIDDMDSSGSKSETPTRQAERIKQEKESAARQSFTHDPNVQDLVDLFDAAIVTESIRPGKP
jgi:DNA polymerase-3 subunit gamma/tau